MKNKFYNYLYDYIVREGFVENKNPKDQKEKKFYVLEYFEKIKKLDGTLLKNMYLERYVIKIEDIPEAYFKHQEQIDFNRGFGYEPLTEDERNNHAEMIIMDQKKSLENILDYFCSNVMNKYSDELKFWALQGILKLSKYDKEKERFGRRTKGTVYPFIELNKEALILTMETMDKLLEEEINNHEMIELTFSNNGALNNSFSKLYTYFFKIVNSRKYLDNCNDGIWIKYDQGSDYNKLIDTLIGKGTGWCTVISSTAERHLKKGDFYVYYTKDEDGKYTEPRIAIRMVKHDTLGEISGIDKNQEVESELKEILNKKLEEFSDKDRYLKKVYDMKMMTLIYRKFQKNIDLSILELRFLYEIDDEIKGFGYHKDPRINEVIDARDIKEDLSKIFNCLKEEIGVEPEPLGNMPFKYYYGDLNLYCYNGDNLTLPKVVMGNLYLDYLVKVDNLVFPEKIEKNLYMRNLMYTDSLNLSCNVLGNIYLNSLRFAREIRFSQDIGGSIRLENLERAINLTFEKNVEGNIHLDSLRTIDELIFGGNVGKNVYLYSLNNVREIIVSDICDYSRLSFLNLDSKKVLVRKR